MSSLTSGLNPEQLKAVTLPRQCALILAGAGSGKTRVLTTRIAHLIQSGEVSPAGILAVTFTNKAAREMLTRLSAMLPINTRGMWVGTFHGLCNRLLRTHHRDAGLLQHYQNRFRYILVDEFQDTNKLQYQWIKMLAGSNGCVFAVGDDDQSIYRFRGAEVGNMNEFVRDFGVKEVVKLEQNYRSQGHILDAANAIIQQNKARLGKNLWTAQGKGEPLRVYAAANDDEEARFIVDEVKALHREGMALSEMALLYRSNAQSRILEHSLFRAGIAYRVYGGLRFFERQEVKHALAYLRLAGNPDDDTAFSRVVNFPPRGIGSRSVEQLQEAAERGMGSLMHVARSGIVSGRSGAAIGQFIAVIDAPHKASETLTLAELIEEVLEKSRLKDHYAAEKDGRDRLENLHELINAAALFAEDFEHGLEPAGEAQEDVAAVAGTPEQQVLAGFLSHASLEAGERAAAAGQDALQLMTVQSAKGLR